jgi:hypothetical protein
LQTFGHTVDFTGNEATDKNRLRGNSREHPEGPFCRGLLFWIVFFTPFMTWFGYSQPTFERALAVTLEMVAVMTPVFLFTELANRLFKIDKS